MDFFLHHLDQNTLLDITPTKTSPTWHNMCTGEDRIAKGFDRFLVGEGIAASFGLIRQWVACRGELDHRSIVLDMRGGASKPPSPFKFSEGWLKDPSFIDLVHNLWTPLDQNGKRHATEHFMENLKNIKKPTISWPIRKNLGMIKILWILILGFKLDWMVRG